MSGKTAEVGRGRKNHILRDATVSSGTTKEGESLQKRVGAPNGFGLKAHRTKSSTSRKGGKNMKEKLVKSEYVQINARMRVTKNLLKAKI